MQNTPVKELMTRKPILVRADDTLQEAACKMRDADCGILPVGTEDSLQGIITDRDIVMRAVAQGKNPAKEKVGDYMTKQVCTCIESDTLEDAARNMHQNRISRLVVKNKLGKVTGILSFGSILRNDARPEELVSIIKHAAGPVVG